MNELLCTGINVLSSFAPLSYQLPFLLISESYKSISEKEKFDFKIVPQTGVIFLFGLFSKRSLAVRKNGYSLLIQNHPEQTTKLIKAACHDGASFQKLLTEIEKPHTFQWYHKSRIVNDLTSILEVFYPRRATLLKTSIDVIESFPSFGNVYSMYFNPTLYGRIKGVLENNRFGLDIYKESPRFYETIRILVATSPVV